MIGDLQLAHLIGLLLSRPLLDPYPVVELLPELPPELPLELPELLPHLMLARLVPHPASFRFKSLLNLHLLSTAIGRPLKE